MPRLALHHIAAVALISAGIANLPLLVTAEDLEAEDVPPECAQVCAPIVELTGRCDAMTEQRFGDFRKRWDSHQVSQRTSRKRMHKRKRRVGKGSRKRQESDSESDSDSGSEVENSGRPPAAAAAAAKQANKECVCGERSFNVVGVLNSCATCIAGNSTAVEANEDIKEIIAECGLDVPLLPPPAAPATTSAPPVVVVPADPPVNTGPTTSLPAMLAPERPSEGTPSASTSSTPPPPPPDVQTPPGPPLASPTPEVSITPVTVFETPSFRTLPPIVSPNDFPPPRSDVQSGAASRFDGWLFGRAMLVLMAVLILR